MNSPMKATILPAMSLLVLFASTLSVPAQNAPAVTLANAAAPAHSRVIVVSLEDRRLALVEDGVVKAVYPVAVGKATTPSPTGTFTIVDRVTNPTYYHHGKVVPAGPQNPVGNRWMGLSVSGYGIHGTNQPRSIGRAASHGCIRVGRRDLELLFAQVRIGDTVEILGERDAQTVALFGQPDLPHSSAAPVLTAANAPEAAAAQAAEPASPASR